MPHIADDFADIAWRPRDKMAEAVICRACGKHDPVMCYPDDHSQAICPDCCVKAEHADGETGHVFIYDRWEGHYCTHCGINRNCTDYQPFD